MSGEHRAVEIALNEHLDGDVAAGQRAREHGVRREVRLVDVDANRVDALFVAGFDHAEAAAARRVEADIRAVGDFIEGQRLCGCRVAPGVVVVADILGNDRVRGVDVRHAFFKALLVLLDGGNFHAADKADNTGGGFPRGQNAGEEGDFVRCVRKAGNIRNVVHNRVKQHEVDVRVSGRDRAQGFFLVEGVEYNKIVAFFAEHLRSFGIHGSIGAFHGLDLNAIVLLAVHQACVRLIVDGLVAERSGEHKTDLDVSGYDARGRFGGYFGGRFRCRFGRLGVGRGRALYGRGCAGIGEQKHCCHQQR